MNNRVAQIVVGSNGRQVAASLESAYQRLAADFLGVRSEEVSADPVGQLADSYDWPVFLGDVVRLTPAAVLAAHVAVSGQYGDVVEIVEHDLDRPFGQHTEVRSIDLVEPGSPAFALSLAVLELEHGEEPVEDRAEALRETIEGLVEEALARYPVADARETIANRDAAFIPTIEGVKFPLLPSVGDVEAALRSYPDALAEVYRGVAAKLWPDQAPAP